MKGGFDVTLKGWRLLAILALWLGSLVGLAEFAFMIVERMGRSPAAFVIVVCLAEIYRQMVNPVARGFRQRWKARGKREDRDD